jgi:hypothetical protein
VKILALLLLGGCATQSLDDLYLQRAACVTSGGECSDLDALITRKEDIQTMRENAKPPECPSGSVAYCDSFTRGCGQKRTRQPIKWTCVSWDAFR